MKSLFKKPVSVESTHEGFHAGTVIAMIFLVLSFFGATFYILLSSYFKVK